MTSLFQTGNGLQLELTTVSEVYRRVLTVSDGERFQGSTDDV